MNLSEHVATLGRGPGRSRDLTQAEAAEAMALMLDGAVPEAVGALLMLLRMKGETAAEIAGLAGAAQSACPALPAAALDWPCYAAGRTRGLPWFLLSARLVAQAGYPVVLHGWNGSDPALRAHLAEAGIGMAAEPPNAQACLARDQIVYLPLEGFHPALFALLSLRQVLGLRSCINTVCRMLNPARAAASVQGVFHPSYRLLQADAAALMGWEALSVIKGGGGEFERNPGKDIAAFGLRGGEAWEQVWASGAAGGVRLAEGPTAGATLGGLWSGASPDPFAEAVVIGTAALALDTLGASRPETLARQLWATRPAGQEGAA